jgi:hypothetical protein
MRKSGGEPVVFIVPGQARTVDDAATRGAAPRALPIELEGARFKHSVRAGTERGGGTVRVTAVPGEDVVVLHIAGGPSLYLHPNSAEDLLRAQAHPEKDRGATTTEESDTGEVKVPIRLQWSGLNGAADTRGGSRGFFGDVLLAGVDVITNLFKKGAAKGISMKVSEKGGVSVYGLGRFPVTLYQEQWVKLLDMADDIRAFIRSNESSLKTKS